MFTFPICHYTKDPPEISFLGAFANGGGTGLAIGPARPDRIIVVAAQKEQDGTTAFATPTINGGGATIIVQPAISDPVVMGYAVVPSGTTVDLACTGGTRMFGWVITGVTVLDQTITNTSSTVDLDLTGTMPAEPSVIIGIARGRSTQSSFSSSISGVLNNGVTDSFSTSGSGNSSWVGARAKSDGSGSGTLRLTGSNAFSSGYGAAAVFK